MFFSLMPIELNHHIVGFIQPAKVTSAQIKNCARQLANISLINREFNQICCEKLATLKKINALVNKYSKYNGDYENPSRNWKTGAEIDPKGNPQLLDALLLDVNFLMLKAHLILIIQK